MSGNRSGVNGRLQLAAALQTDLCTAYTLTRRNDIQAAQTTGRVLSRLPPGSPGIPPLHNEIAKAFHFDSRFELGG